MSGTVHLPILVALSAGIVVWAFGCKRKRRFDGDAKFPVRDQGR